MIGVSPSHVSKIQASIERTEPSDPTKTPLGRYYVKPQSPPVRKSSTFTANPFNTRCLVDFLHTSGSIRRMASIDIRFFVPINFNYSCTLTIEGFRL